MLLMIYKNLNFSDQLNFAQVNAPLRTIFENFIVQAKYPKIKIRKLYHKEELIVANENDEDCMLLTYDEIEKFLKFHANDIDELHMIAMDKIFYFLEPSQISCTVPWANLRDLTCLHCEDLSLSEKHLLLIAENCLKLSELRLIGCENEEKVEKSLGCISTKEPLMQFGCLVNKNDYKLTIGHGVGVSTLKQMKTLKTLVVYGGMTIDISLFSELISLVHLECLRTDALVVQNVQSNQKESDFNLHLKELEIKLKCESLEFLESIGIFKNLLNLHLNISDDVTDSALQTIAKACGNLVCLTFGRNTFFRNITHFPIPSNLKALYILECWDLKYTYLQDALNKFKIEKFICKSEPFESEEFFNNITISTNIIALDLESVNTYEYSSFYSDNNTLKELHWYEQEQNVLQQTHNRECLKTCRNLKNLFIHSGFVPLNIILELNQLHKFQIQTLEQVNWTYIIGLLKHSSLKELYIDSNMFDGTLPNDFANIPIQGFTSSITIVAIRFDMLDQGLRFWLDMLQQNPKISLRCDLTSEFYTSFLEKLIHHEYFPKNIREIKVWGFNLNCKHLRENFWATIHPLQMIADDFHKNETIVLSRK